MFYVSLSRFVFFKLKTAYEMRISDWSSDVCSSGLVTLAAMLGQVGLPGGGFAVGYGPANTMGNNTTMFPGPTLNQGVNKVKDFIPVARIADMLQIGRA